MTDQTQNSQVSDSPVDPKTGEKMIKYHVFKNANPVASVPIGDGKFLAFQNGEGYLEDNKKNQPALEKIRNWIENFPEYGISQVAGHETMHLPVNEMARNRPKRELNQFLANQAAASKFKGDDRPAQYVMQATASSDSPTTGGKSAPAPRFAQVDGDAAERLRLAAMTGGLAQATSQVIQSKVPQESTSTAPVVYTEDKSVDKLVEDVIKPATPTSTPVTTPAVEGQPQSVKEKLEAMKAQQALAAANK